MSANHPRYLNVTDVIDKPNSTARKKPVSAYQLTLSNQRVTTLENIGIETRLENLESGLKILKVPIEADAFTAPMALPNATTNFMEGTMVLDVWIVCTDTDSTNSLQLKHGGVGGAAITSAMACETADVLTRTTTLASPVVTAEGLVVVAGAAVDRGVMYILYI